MRIILFAILLLSTASSTFGQLTNTRVTLIEEQEPKRINHYAQNNADKKFNIFR